METNNNNPPKSVILIDLEEDDAENEDDEIMELPPPTTSSQQEEQLQTLRSIESSETPGEASNPRNPRRKVIQQCLALLLHAQRCDIVQEESSELQIRCVQPHCGTIKELLRHQKTCQSNQQCKISRCSSSRMILKHWDSCKRGDCPLCSPLRRRFNIPRSSDLPKPDVVLKPPRILALAPPSCGDNTRLLPNPFAACRARRELDGESWDDDPVEIQTSPASANSRGNQRLETNEPFTSTPKDFSGRNGRSNFDVSGPSRRKKHWSSSYNPRGYPHDSGDNRGFRYRSNSRSWKSSNPRRFQSEFHQPRHVHHHSRSESHTSQASFDSRPRESSVAEGHQKMDAMKMTQEQMLMLIHAFKCRKSDERGVPSKCMNTTCRSTKHLLEHMKNCERTINCWVPRCISSKRILIHVNECRNDKCDLCSPLGGSLGGGSTRASQDQSDGGVHSQ